MTGAPQQKPWLLYQMQGSLQKGLPENHYGFFFRSDVQASCPICGSRLKCIGSRYRICIREDGEKIYIIIRRLRCKNKDCRIIHHELPDLLVPYKRHASVSIEKILTFPGSPVTSDIGAEDGTFRAWNRWFRRLAGNWRGCLQAINHRMGQASEEDVVSPSQSLLQALYSLVGSHSGWLARIVRSVVNAGLWVHTRSEWLPDPP